MKVVPVTEAAPQLGQLVIDALNGEVVHLTIGGQSVELIPSNTAAEDEFESPELEAELLRSLQGKPIPYVKGMFQERLRAYRERQNNAQ